MRNLPDGLRGDALQDVCHLDGLGDVVDEEDQQGQRREREDDAHRYRHGRHEVLVPLDRAQDKQAVGESGDEAAEDYLVHPVSHVVPQNAGAELVRGQGQGHHRHGEEDAGDGDRRRADRRQQARGAAPVAADDPGADFTKRGVDGLLALGQKEARPIDATLISAGTNQKLSRRFRFIRL